MDYGWFVILNGALYVLIAVFTIPLHVIVAMSILKTGTVKKRITLRILLSLALADVVQLLFQGIGGLYICMGVPLDDIFNNIMGFCMNGLWGVTLIQHVMLALNRLRVVTAKTVIREEEFRYFDRQKLSGANRLITGRDLRLFIQTSLVFILAITHVGTWNLAPNPDIYLLSVLNMEWVLVCALLPYLNLAMSSDIRNALLRVLKISKQSGTFSGPVVTVFTTYKRTVSTIPQKSASN